VSIAVKQMLDLYKVELNWFTMMWALASSVGWPCCTTSCLQRKQMLVLL